jgi:hypothetical protein
MSMEVEVFGALKGLVENRVYPDIAPVGTDKPYITYQQIGGQGINFLDLAMPGKKNSWVQVNVWAESRLSAAAITSQVEQALRSTATLQATVLSAPTAIHEPDTKLYGAMQDFSFWTD